METKPGLTKNDALIHQTLSKKTGVRGRLYHLTTGGLIGVRQQHGQLLAPKRHAYNKYGSENG